MRYNHFSASWHAQVQRLAATPKLSFRAPLYRFLYHLYNLLCTSPGSSKIAEIVRGFLIKVNRSPIRLKLTDTVLDDWFIKFSIYCEKCMKLLWNLLDRATLIIIFHTEDTVMELPIWYRLISNPFSWHVSKFKLHWYKIVIMVTKNVRGAGFFGTPCIIMTDVIWFIRRSIAARRCACHFTINRSRHSFKMDFLSFIFSCLNYSFKLCVMSFVMYSTIELW